MAAFLREPIAPRVASAHALVRVCERNGVCSSACAYACAGEQAPCTRLFGCPDFGRGESSLAQDMHAALRAFIHSPPFSTWTVLACMSAGPSREASVCSSLATAEGKGSSSSDRTSGSWQGWRKHVFVASFENQWQIGRRQCSKAQRLQCRRAQDACEGATPSAHEQALAGAAALHILGADPKPSGRPLIYGARPARSCQVRLAPPSAIELTLSVFGCLFPPPAASARSLREHGGAQLSKLTHTSY